ncbi:MAG: chorismate-binding protein, partial [Candidatus Limnocylindria bacterium]
MTTAALTRVTSVELAADTLTPVAAALRLGPRCAFLLESVEGGARYGRYSIAGVHGRTLVVGTDEGDPLEVLRAALPRVEPMAGDPAFPLASGVGYLAYEAAARWERLPVPDADPLGMPDAVFHLPSSVIVFDHLAQVARVATLDGPGASERLDEVTTALATPAEGEVPATFAAAVVPEEIDTDDRARYERGVAQLVAEIHAGEMLQTVIARRFSVATRRSAIEIYRSLRRINPSPYLYFLD